MTAEWEVAGSDLTGSIKDKCPAFAMTFTNG